MPVQATETKSGKGKVVDANGFSVCNTGGGSYKEQREVAAKIANALNNYDRLREALRKVSDLDYMSTENALDWLESNCPRLRALLQELGE